MNILLSESLFLGITISIASYIIGMELKKKIDIFLFNPLLVSILLTIGTLLLFNINYTTYINSAKYLSYLLTPATICLAIPLYEKLNLLKNNKTAILAGIISGVLTSLASILLLSILFKLEHKEYVTLLPKSITTAIGIGLSQELSGYVTITVTAIILTGLLGNIIAQKVCKIARINNPIARGIAIGTASHAMGTAKAMEMGEVEGAMSSLSIAIAGILTVGGAIFFSYFY